MKIVYWGKGKRALNCLQAIIHEGYQVALVVEHPEEAPDSSFRTYVREHGLLSIDPADPNTAEVKEMLQSIKADLFVLGGYGKILKKNIINLPPKPPINLHAGRLPYFRGSSPLNWALIKGEDSFGLSILYVDGRIDRGDLLCEREFPIKEEDTIHDLHKKANQAFPEMLLEVLNNIKNGNQVATPQDETKACYYPLRFPEDGRIFLDQITSEELHNRIRALTKPYSGVYTYWQGKRIKLYAAEHFCGTFYGESGRIYRKHKDKILVACKDQCLWLRDVEFEDPNLSFFKEVKVYDRFTTVGDYIEKALNIKL